MKTFIIFWYSEPNILFCYNELNSQTPNFHHYNKDINLDDNIDTFIEIIKQINPDKIHLPIWNKELRKEYKSPIFDWMSWDNFCIKMEDTFGPYKILYKIITDKVLDNAIKDNTNKDPYKEMRDVYMEYIMISKSFKPDDGYKFLNNKILSFDQFIRTKTAPCIEIINDIGDIRRYNLYMHNDKLVFLLDKSE